MFKRFSGPSARGAAALALVIGFSWVTPAYPTRIRDPFSTAADASDLRHILWLPWAGRNGQPVTLKPLGRYSNDRGPMEALAVDEASGLAYVGQGPRIVVVDLSLPGSPRELRSLEALGGTILALRLSGDRLYAAVEGVGLVILHVDKREEPVVVGTYPDAIRRIAGDDKLVIATAGGGPEDSDSRVLAIDVREAARPLLLDTLTARRVCPFTDVDTSGDRAYVSADTCGLFAVDIGRPALMRIVYYGHPSGWDGSRLLAKDDRIFQVMEGATVELRDGRRLEAEALGRVDRFVFPDGATWYTDLTRDLAVHGHVLLLVGRFDRHPAPDVEGLWAVDVTDPGRPVLLAAAESALPATVAATAAHVYVAGADGLLIYPAVP